MTTLADMTPEQRQQCVGMWFDTIFGLGILEALQEEPKEGDPFGRFMHPDRGSWHTESFKGLTPRHDLPRAWNPDGTPPKGGMGGRAMTNRWQVRVHQSHTNGSKNPKRRWVVDPPGYDHTNRTWGDHRWHVAGGKWFQWDENNITKREAWEQALAYADHMARTVRVELPADPNKDAPYVGYKASSEYPLLHQFGVSEWEPSNVISLESSQIEPFALALLAHHHKNQETP